MTSFFNTENAISISNILEVEKFIDLQFPDEYKDHLLKYNGGQCFPNYFFFYKDGEKEDSYVDWFLAIYEGEYDNLLDYIKIYKTDEKRLPCHIVPIAHDPLGNLICISCNNIDKGYIYFWDHENEVDYKVSDDNDLSNLYLIAQSFNLFISELKDE